MTTPESNGEAEIKGHFGTALSVKGSLNAIFPEIHEKLC